MISLIRAKYRDNFLEGVGATSVGILYRFIVKELGNVFNFCWILNITSDSIKIIILFVEIAEGKLDAKIDWRFDDKKEEKFVLIKF